MNEWELDKFAKHTHILLNDEYKNKLKALCWLNDMNYSQLMRSLIDKEFNEKVEQNKLEKGKKYEYRCIGRSPRKRC